MAINDERQGELIIPKIIPFRLVLLDDESMLQIHFSTRNLFPKKLVGRICRVFFHKGVHLLKKKNA